MKDQNKEQNVADNTAVKQQNLPDNTVKDPEDWTTGGERMTGAQRSYLNTMAGEAGEDVDTSLTKAEASKKIEELQKKTGRDQGNEKDVTKP